MSMKRILFVIAVFVIAVNSLIAQNLPVNSRIDMLLIQGNYLKVIDTCKQILTHDSLNSEIYYKLRDMNNSINYCNKVIKILTPVNVQLGLTYTLYAESLKSNGMYKDAINSYLKAQGIGSYPNIYDEKLNDRENAIYYYQKFLDHLETAKMNFPSEYVETIKKRLEFIKNNPNK